MHLQRLGAEDWSCLRALRLEAVRSDPDAFWVTEEQLLRLDEAQWRGSFDDGRIVLAVTRDESPTGSLRDGEDVLGLLTVLRDGYTPEHPTREGECAIAAMFVRPSARSTGVAALLFQGVCEIAQELGRPLISLEVSSRNTRAQRAYEKVGFRPTGVRNPFEREGAEWVEYSCRAEDLRQAL